MIILDYRVRFTFSTSRGTLGPISKIADGLVVVCADHIRLLALHALCELVTGCRPTGIDPVNVMTLVATDHAKHTMGPQGSGRWDILRIRLSAEVAPFEAKLPRTILVRARVAMPR
jgi:hypothetical protein